MRKLFTRVTRFLRALPGAPVQFEGGTFGREDSGVNLSCSRQMKSMCLGGLVEILGAFDPSKIPAVR